MQSSSTHIIQRMCDFKPTQLKSKLHFRAQEDTPCKRIPLKTSGFSSATTFTSRRPEFGDVTALLCTNTRLRNSPPAQLLLHLAPRPFSNPLVNLAPNPEMRRTPTGDARAEAPLDCAKLVVVCAQGSEVATDVVMAACQCACHQFGRRLCFSRSQQPSSRHSQRDRQKLSLK